MLEIIISFLLGLSVGGTIGGVAGVYVSHSLKPINNIQETTQNTLQTTEVFQGQITVVVSDKNAITNININIKGITNFSLMSNFYTNKKQK